MIGATAVAVAMIISTAAALADQQTPAFRGGTDIVLVDALVVARDGSPLEGLKPDQFEVFVDGRRRAVLSADFVRSVRTGGTAAAATAISPNRPPDPAGRTIVLAVDESSFPVAAQASAREAVTRVVDRVAPEDSLGMITFPGDVAIAPTREHGAVRAAIARIVGARVDAGQSSRFNLSASEAAQVRSRTAVATKEIIDRECGREWPPNPSCPQEVMETAIDITIALEQQGMTTIAGLQRTIDAVRSLPGRKTLMVISAGLPMSTRGSHLDFAAETARVASRAAAANVNLYVLYMNVHFLQFFSASYRKVNHSIYADIAMFGQGLERFADSAGGAFFQIEVDSDPFVDRALRETSATYLLGVRADPKDQDGREHFIRVSVKARGATIRHRRVLVIPTADR